ncbi:MAG: radical SAM protein [Candidatus Ratteibacteria bacterium]|jgi:radical SAM protein with 4Fe4S-binding SPASM domain
MFFIYEVTSRCNNNCRYCYNVWKEKSGYPRKELTLSEIRELFDRVLKEVSPDSVTFAGGEPLLHRDIVEIASFFNQRKIKLGIATNGILLDEEKVSALVSNGVGYFEISLPSIKQEAYSYLSRNDQLQKVRNAILLVKKYRAKLNVSVVITKQNLLEVADVIDLCFAFSADSVSLNRFVPGGEGLNNLPGLTLTEEELGKALFASDRKAREYNFPINVTVPVESCLIDQEQYPNLNFGTCVCGRNKWVIDSSGNLRTCEQNPEILGSLFEDSFLKLTELEKVKYFQANNLKKNCPDCKKFSNCGGGCRILNMFQNEGSQGWNG